MKQKRGAKLSRLCFFTLAPPNPIHEKIVPACICRCLLCVVCCPPFLQFLQYLNNTGNKKFFRYNQSSNIASLDPAFSKDQSTIWACNQLYNSLVALDDKLNTQPSIAKSWEISEDGKTYTFHLRSDVMFHHNECFEAGKGRPVNANDVVFSFKRIIDTKVASPGAWIFNNSVDSVEPFKALDDSTFQLKLLKPSPAPCSAF